MIKTKATYLQNLGDFWCMSDSEMPNTFIRSKVFIINMLQEIFSPKKIFHSFLNIKILYINNINNINIINII